MGLKFALVGGDLRNVKLASILAAEGCTVYTYGISHSSIGTNFNRCSELGEAIAMGDFIIGPMPFTLGGSKPLCIPAILRLTMYCVLCRAEK